MVCHLACVAQFVIYRGELEAQFDVGLVFVSSVGAIWDSFV